MGNLIHTFDHWFVDSRRVYCYYFDAIPSVCELSPVKGEKVLGKVREDCESIVVGEFRYTESKPRGKKVELTKAVLVLSNRCVLTFGNDYCEVLHDGTQPEFVGRVMDIGRSFKGKAPRRPLEIHIIIQGRSALELKGMEVKRTKLDIDLFYEDDFKPVDELIRNRLNKRKDKGVVLLHGLPGTGKTSYLRYLVGKVRKRVLFLSPKAATDLMEPAFLDLLMGNPDSIVVIEDAESIVMERRPGMDSCVSGLLNISDGLLADFLNVQLICTFNSDLAWVDSALLRQGRLIAQYRFGRLGIPKAQRLSDHLGQGRTITRPMTLAEICHPGDAGVPANTTRTIIGFRREVVEN